MIQITNKKKIVLNILYYFCNVYNGCYKHKGRVMNKEECNLGYTKLGDCIKCLYGTTEKYQTQKGDDE